MQFLCPFKAYSVKSTFKQQSQSILCFFIKYINKLFCVSIQIRLDINFNGYPDSLKKMEKNFLIICNFLPNIISILFHSSDKPSETDDYQSRYTGYAKFFCIHSKLAFHHLESKKQHDDFCSNQAHLPISDFFVWKIWHNQRDK